MAMVFTQAWFLASLAFATASPHAPLGGYYPVSNIIEHSQISQDVADFTLALDVYDFEAARNIYTNGRYSCKTVVVRRTLQGFVSASTVPKLRGVEFYEHFVGNQSGSIGLSLTFWDDLVIQALNGTGAFHDRTPSFRKVVLQKAILGIVTLYATYEMESSIAKASTPSERTDSGAGHAWDEAWAFMYGSFGGGKYSVWEALKKRDLDFAFKSSKQIQGAIVASDDVLSYFQQGLHAIRNETYSEQVLREARDYIYQILALTSIRNVLKYGYRASQRMSDGTSYNADYHAEAFTYFLAGASWIERSMPGTAKSILQLIPLDQNISNTELYCDLQRILIPAYSSLGLDCAMVGTWKDLPSNVSCTNLPACPLSSSVRDTLPGYLPTNVSTKVGSNLDCDPLYPFPVQTTSTTTIANSTLLTFLQSHSALACLDGTSICSFGCYDNQRQGCYSGITQQQCTSAVGSNVSWASKCDCQCRRLVCNMGCWDYEDESCLAGIDQNGCAEIYAHVAWLRKCKCREVTGNMSSLGNDGDFTDETASSTSIYFSVPAFVVLFRESLEVMILLVIMIQFLHKAKEDGTIDDTTFRRFRFQVYAGSGLGFLLCLTLGICLLAVASLAYGLFEGTTKTIFAGVMTLLTSFVLTLLAINFYKMIFNRFEMENKMQQQVLQTVETARKADTADQSFSQRYAFFIMALTTGTREGLESIVFLIGVVSDMDDLSSLPLPIISALVLARVLGCCFFQGTKKLRLDWFMRGSALVLLLIAAGAFTSALHAFQELGAFGTWTPKSQRGWQNKQVWDSSECCSDKTNRFFVLMNALVGWQDKPTAVGFFSYVFYWIVVIILGFFVMRHLSRKQKKRQEQLCKEAAAHPSEEENTFTDVEIEAVGEDVARTQTCQGKGDAQSNAV